MLDNPPARLIFLGTGSSLGVPYIGCTCRVCTSSEPRNFRRRCSIHLQAESTHIQVDTPPDFREQALRHGITRIDAALFTHAHADHIFGFDDLRRFGDIQRAPIPIWTSAQTLSEMRGIFSYAQPPPPSGKPSYVPQVQWGELPEAPLSIGPFEVQAFQVPHGDSPALGFLIRLGSRSIGYFPDCSDLPPPVRETLHGIDVLILNTLRYRPYPKHLHWDLALELAAQIQAGTTYLTHLSHDIDYIEATSALPPGIRLAYDDLVLDLAAPL